MTTSKELATQEPTLQPLGAITIADHRNNRQMLLQVMKEEMVPGIDYGISPGADKPALWKPGAEKLISIFCFAPSFGYTCELHENLHRTYTIKCTLKHRGTNTFLGDADAVCSTLESRYVNRKDPTAIVNPADYFNTAMKVGGKRALIAAVLFVTAASDIFTQDLDDDEETAKGAGAGAERPAGGLPTRPRGTDASKTGPGLWTGIMGGISIKTYKGKDGKVQEYYILFLEDGRSASTFDTVIPQIAREARGKTVKINTKPGKKAGFFNIESFEVIEAKPAAPKPEEREPENIHPVPDRDLEREPEDIPFRTTIYRDVKRSRLSRRYVQ